MTWDIRHSKFHLREWTFAACDRNGHCQQNLQSRWQVGKYVISTKWHNEHQDTTRCYDNCWQKFDSLVFHPHFSTGRALSTSSGNGNAAATWSVYFSCKSSRSIASPLVMSLLVSNRKLNVFADIRAVETEYPSQPQYYCVASRLHHYSFVSSCSLLSLHPLPFLPTASSFSSFDDWSRHSIPHVFIPSCIASTQNSIFSPLQMPPTTQYASHHWIFTTAICSARLVWIPVNWSHK